MPRTPNLQQQRRFALGLNSHSHLRRAVLAQLTTKVITRHSQFSFPGKKFVSLLSQRVVLLILHKTTKKYKSWDAQSRRVPCNLRAEVPRLRPISSPPCPSARCRITPPPGPVPRRRRLQRTNPVPPCHIVPPAAAPPPPARTIPAPYTINRFGIPPPLAMSVTVTPVVQVVAEEEEAATVVAAAAVEVEAGAAAAAAAGAAAEVRFPQAASDAPLSFDAFFAQPFVFCVFRVFQLNRVPCFSGCGGGGC